jgi:hypothetical protein
MKKFSIALVVAGLLSGFAVFANASELIKAVPEPENYAMFLAGIGMLGVMVRRG